MPDVPDVPDPERRFGGLRRLHGDANYARLRGARFAVVGLGGVGSWVVEAFARCGVAGLSLIDLDHVSESNINRQVQALDATIGMAKGEALRQRVAQIHAGCEVEVIDAFVDESNWPTLLGAGRIDGLVDACDQVRAKAVLADWACRYGIPFVTVGAAGGKLQPQAVQIEDLATVTHDPLLAALRQRLRKQHGAARAGPMGVACVFSREPVQMPVQTAVVSDGGSDGVSVDVSADVPGDVQASKVDGSLNCHGYGSSVTVTASFGLCAAAELQRLFLSRAP